MCERERGRERGIKADRGRRCRQTGRSYEDSKHKKWEKVDHFS